MPILQKLRMNDLRSRYISKINSRELNHHYRLNQTQPHLERKIGLLALSATGICSMLGASINVVPFMIHRSVPGIGPYVLPAFFLAMIPALLAAFAYSALASSMPRAGGSYIYASRGLSPYLGFVASFSQWFGLSIVIGVIAYIIVPFFRDIFEGIGWNMLALSMEVAWIRLSIALVLIWTFVYVNFLGGKFYERTVIPLMVIMFGLGLIVVVAGFAFDQEDFRGALSIQNIVVSGSVVDDIDFSWQALLSAAAVLFSSFIGFDAIAQAGGEAKKPGKYLPAAILIAITIVGGYYFLFTTSVYHAVPWSFVLQEATIKDITAPGLIGYLLPPTLTVLILVGAAIALINDLPAMLLSVSRLVFAWSNDGVFPAGISKIHSKQHTPHRALFLSGTMASIGVLGSHFAGDFFLGIDIMVTSMMVNFLLMCLTLVTIHWINPSISSQMTFMKKRRVQRVVGIMGVLLLSGFLIVHTVKDLRADVSSWYYHSSYIWLIVMCIGSSIYFVKMHQIKKAGIDINSHFKKLPNQ